MTKEQTSTIISAVIALIITVLGVFGYNVIVVQPQLAAIEQTQRQILGVVQAGAGEQGITGQNVTGFTSVNVEQDLAVGDDLTVAGDATIDTMIVTMTNTERLQILAPTAQPTATPGLRINVAGVNEPLVIQKSLTPVARVNGAGQLTIESLVANGASTLTGAVNSATALLTGRQVVTVPTAQATATPGVYVNSAGAVSALQVWALNATPVAAIDRSGNLSASGTFRPTGAIYDVAPVLAKTEAYTLTVADTGSMVKASGAITIMVPGAAAGLNYCVVNYTGDDQIIDFVDATDVALNEVNAPGDKITNTTVYDHICLMALDTTNWVTLSSIGTWTDGN